MDLLKGKNNYEVFEAPPGGHSFDRMNTNIGKEIRLKVHLYLAEILRPEKPSKNLQDHQKAGYKF